MPNLIHLSQIQEGMKLQSDVNDLQNKINNEENGIEKRLTDVKDVNDEQNKRIDELENKDTSVKWEEF